MKHSHFGFLYVALQEPKPPPIHGGLFAQVPPVPAGSPAIHIDATVFNDPFLQAFLVLLTFCVPPLVGVACFRFKLQNECRVRACPGWLRPGMRQTAPI